MRRSPWEPGEEEVLRKKSCWQCTISEWRASARRLVVLTREVIGAERRSAQGWLEGKA